ncbi:hypothetical protein ACO34A_26825 (plasmid) [Rhizobium sp. ACO-34A]|nr:hypothetical protein ACO34A_26825 [Rhizobium sp. ACO-34A]
MRILSVLAQYGFSAASISLAAMPDGQEFSSSRLVVTYTAMIGHARAMLNLPVVNIEAFMFEKPHEAASQQVRRFDGEAFLKRIFLIMNSERRLAI